MDPLFLLAVLAASVLVALAAAKAALGLVLHLMSGTPLVNVAFSPVRPAAVAMPLSEHAQV